MCRSTDLALKEKIGSSRTRRWRFDRHSFGDFVQIVSICYGVPIDLDPILSDRLLTADYKDHPLEMALCLSTALIGGEMKIEEGRLQIRAMR